MAFSVELDKHSLSVGREASAEWKIILRWILIFSDGLRLSPQENVWKGVFSQRTPFEASEMSNIKGNAWELITFSYYCCSEENLWKDDNCFITQIQDKRCAVRPQRVLSELL